MRNALIASAVAHVGILTAGLIGLSSVQDLSAPPVDSLPVDLVPVSELTTLQLGSKKEKEIREAAVEPTKTPPQAKPKTEEAPGDTKIDAPKPTPGEKTASVAPAASEPQPAPEPPQPEPEPEVAPKEEAPKAQAELGPDVKKDESPLLNVATRPRTKPKPPVRQPEPQKEQPKFDPNNIAALLNKTQPAASGSQASTQQASLGSAQGRTNVRMTQSELNALRSQIARCWNPPVGAVGAEALIVRLQFSMSRTGEVEGNPVVLNSNNNPAFNAAVQSATRAIFRCGPYSLPANKYEAWQTVILNFDPREMLGY
ncbi:cell envelope biogenesis protein TolA [Rhodobacteraceae bacterium RKSG542]|uniref:cell envelope biogenesis protein TolA n=1 Tax=Pseudovibrio flavus TaxID=2529854 RepID=UPI0012BD2BE0|nr:cell envelope biogenesis protein TolA [Pseudovibrio flavus]MTI16601.1 cell envelope biogenesis protein TolA [Pseudovibrio flavus]